MKKNADILKKMVPHNCQCKKQKPQEKLRGKFGTCVCDTYGLSYHLGITIANSIYRYIHDASAVIVREDWEELEKCADTIMKFSQAEPFDIGVKEYGKLKKEFKKTLLVIADKWQGLWW